MSRQTNVDRFPFAFVDDGDDSAIAQKWHDESGANAVLDTRFDGPQELTRDDLDVLAYGSALSGLL